MRDSPGTWRWLRWLVVVVVVAAVPAYLALASNMGYKLPYKLPDDHGTKKAVNRLLLGSGVTLDHVAGGETDPADSYMVLEVGPSTKDSNMGFKITTHLDPPKQDAMMTLWGDPIVEHGLEEVDTSKPKLQWSIDIHELPEDGLLVHHAGRTYRVVEQEQHGIIPILLLIPD